MILYIFTVSLIIIIIINLLKVPYPNVQGTVYLNRV